jgi:Spy/CpxP family protein refolding chaperone
MKRNLATLGIIFSVVLNVAFVGSFLLQESGLFSRAARGTPRSCLLYEELNLTPEQLEKFAPLRDDFHAFVDLRGRQIKSKRLELIDLLAIGEPARKEIDAGQKEIRVLQRRMQAKVIDHLLEESKILTHEQRERFFALIRARIEKSAAPRPRWMPPKHAGPSKGKGP